MNYHLNEDVNSSQGERSDVIGWNVYADNPADASALMTRALIDDYNALREACTQSQDREAEKIGLLGKYTLNGTATLVFDNVDLWWWDKEDGNPYNDYLGNGSYWNYPGENVLWTNGAEYTFKAYFPKGEVQLQAGSGADRLIAVYDTEESQYDFMVAHRKLGAYEENPVSLDMHHALAALKFDFLLADDDITDRLHSCWLENGSQDGFYTTSTLNFDQDIVWPKSTAVPPGSPVYYWKPSEPLEINGSKAVDAYSTYATDENGSVFTANEGWLLVIPQSSDKYGALKLCFRTTAGGDNVYRLDLPAYDFIAGYRYTYHVKMTATEVKVGLTVADWNERKSSYEIDFNE